MCISCRHCSSVWHDVWLYGRLEVCPRVEYIISAHWTSFSFSLNGIGLKGWKDACWRVWYGKQHKGASFYYHFTFRALSLFRLLCTYHGSTPTSTIVFQSRVNRLSVLGAITSTQQVCVSRMLDGVDENDHVVHASVRTPTWGVHSLLWTLCDFPCLVHYSLAFDCFFFGFSASLLLLLF